MPDGHQMFTLHTIPVSVLKAASSGLPGLTANPGKQSHHQGQIYREVKKNTTSETLVCKNNNRIDNSNPRGNIKHVSV